MKKTIYTAILFLTIGIIASSCKKTESPVDLSGTTWEGDATIDAIIHGTITFIFNADGTLVINLIGGTYQGFWNKSPNSTTVNFIFDEGLAKWKGTGTLNSSTTEFNGTLTRISPNIIYGIFTSTKQ